VRCAFLEKEANPMRIQHPITKIIAAGMLATVLAAPSIAQDQPGRGPGWGMGQSMPGWGWGNGQMPVYSEDGMLDRIDGRLAFLRTELKITDAQSGVWDEVEKTVRSVAETHNADMLALRQQAQDGDFLKMSLPDRIAFQASHMETRLQEIKAIQGAVDKLYAVLDPEQKKVADEIVLPAMGMGMRGGEYGMGPGMMFR
jgi:hypothetical protein